MSFLARLSLKNRSLIALATIAILLIGAYVIPMLKQELFPSLDFPAVSVVTVDAGASPTIVEHDVTNPLEQSIQGIAGIQQMTSYSNQGVSIIVVEYNFGTDINQASQTLLHGLTALQVGQELRMVYSGTTVTKVTLGGTQEDINIQLGTPATTVQGMQNLLIPGPTGNIRLGDIATVTQTYGPPQITHLGGVRTATVSATITSSNIGAVSQDVQQRINALHLPAGATVSLGGVTASQSQAFSGLLLALLIAILLVYLVMMATFRSIILPLILLVSIPFAATGSILLLLITHTALGVPALIGLLMLVGIVVTNAIVLLDLVNQYRAKGLDARAAVVEGGRRRLRPILMTAIATILALLPMALGLSKAGVFIAGPLAIVVIGGLTTSTILTLLLVPTLYVIVEDVRGRFDRRRAPAPTPSERGEDLESRRIDEQEREPHE
ncbi:MAG TPA: efflux RND transporter permease subunit [Ktedonobacteraceae bacterium]|nr:efflux RND transporter permease subunit [Ktedonobacteraceae bacterium]